MELAVSERFESATSSAGTILTDLYQAIGRKERTLPVASSCDRPKQVFTSQEVQLDNVLIQQLGAGEARRAHNPEVTRSKLVVAMLFLLSRDSRKSTTTNVAMCTDIYLRRAIALHESGYWERRHTLILNSSERYDSPLHTDWGLSNCREYIQKCTDNYPERYNTRTRHGSMLVPLLYGTRVHDDGEHGN